MKHLSQRLQDFGVSGREAELYLALLQSKELTAPEIAKLTSVSRTKTYDILQNLVKKRLCNENYKNGNKHFSAIKPDIAIQNLLSVEENEIARKKQAAVNLQAELLNIFNEKAQDASPMEYIEILTDPGQIRERWLTIQERTTTELVGFTKPPYTRALNDNAQFESEVLRRGVRVKSVYEHNTLNTREDKLNLVAVMEEYLKLGEEARVSPELPMKLVISDETITMFALNDRISLKPSITTMIVDHPSFALAMKKVFESFWNTSCTVDEFKRSLNQ